MSARLSYSEVESISLSFKKFFQQSDRLWLFGSRADPSALGGDIDLYIETTLNLDEAIDQKIRFITELYYKIGDQKIDVVLNCTQTNYKLPIYEIARQQGVRLV